VVPVVCLVRRGNFALGVIAGFILNLILGGALPVVGDLAAGFVAGYLAVGAGRGLLAGFISGILGGLILGGYPSAGSAAAGAFPTLPCTSTAVAAARRNRSASALELEGGFSQRSWRAYRGHCCFKELKPAEVCVHENLELAKAA